MGGGASLGAPAITTGTCNGRRSGPSPPSAPLNRIYRPPHACIVSRRQSPYGRPRRHVSDGEAGPQTRTPVVTYALQKNLQRLPADRRTYTDGRRRSSYNRHHRHVSLAKETCFRTGCWRPIHQSLIVRFSLTTNLQRVPRPIADCARWSPYNRRHGHVSVACNNRDVIYFCVSQKKSIACTPHALCRTGRQRTSNSRIMKPFIQASATLSPFPCPPPRARASCPHLALILPKQPFSPRRQDLSAEKTRGPRCSVP